MTRHPLADDRDLRRLREVPVVEIAPGHQRNPERPEVARGDVVERHADALLVRQDLVADPSHRRDEVVAVADRTDRRRGRATHARHGAEGVEQPPIGRRHVGASLPRETRIDREHQHVATVVAGVLRPELGQRPQEQARPHQQHQRERDLRHDQRAIERPAMPAAADLAIGEQPPRRCAANRRQEPEQQARDRGDPPDECQEPQVEREVERQAIARGHRHAQQEMAAPRRERQADRAGQRGEHQRLGEELPDDARAAGAEGEPGGDLALARVRSRQQQGGDIQAGQHQDDHEHNQEEAQRPLVFVAQVALVAGRGRFEAQRVLTREARLDRRPRSIDSDLREDGLRLGFRFAQGRAGLQPAHDVNPGGKGLVPHRPAFLEHLDRPHRNRDVVRAARFRPMEPGRLDADDGEGAAVQRHRHADDARARAEAALPVVVVQHGRRLTGAIIGRLEQTSDRRREAEHTVVVAGDVDPFGHRRLAACRDGDAPERIERQQAAQLRAAGAHRLEVRIRQRVVVSAVRAAKRRDHELLGLRYRKLPQHQADRTRKRWRRWRQSRAPARRP